MNDYSDIYTYLLNLPGIELCRNCFKNANLLNYEIPASMTYIGDYAFYKCIYLIQITIPTSVTSLGKHCFDGCVSLRKIEIPSSVTCINDYAFSRCERMQNINIPSSVTSIGNYAFNKCSILEQMIIPSSVTSIGDNFICECVNLKTIIIPSSVKNIGKINFISFLFLREIKIPPSINYIEESAFYGCLSLKRITIPPSITTIEDGTFYGCHSLNEVNIPSSVTSIGFEAFNDCVSLVEIKIPPSVRTIGFTAFHGCLSLKRIIIQQKVEILTKYPKEIKLVIAGDTNVGKTCFANYYINRTYVDRNDPTIGANYLGKELNIEGHTTKLNIFDISGQIAYRTLCPIFYKNLQGAFVVFDLNEPKTLNEAREFIEGIRKYEGQVPLILIGNKCDLEPKVSREDINVLENDFNLKYIEVSVKDGYNIDEAFDCLISDISNIIFKEKNQMLNLLKYEDKKSNIQCSIY
ncbi:hypothetical protein M9Y10_017662 [Tritrichomonas musculus]|uniref:Uncharacterized protein n=1 Tax=Tritrichomonas musculus TaxID=1915356 RepID=A0ABR2HUH4_9EUKA